MQQMHGSIKNLNKAFDSIKVDTLVAPVANLVENVGDLQKIKYEDIEKGLSGIEDALAPLRKGQPGSTAIAELAKLSKDLKDSGPAGAAAAEKLAEGIDDTATALQRFNDQIKAASLAPDSLDMSNYIKGIQELGKEVENFDVALPTPEVPSEAKAQSVPPAYLPMIDGIEVLIGALNSQAVNGFTEVMSNGATALQEGSKDQASVMSQAADSISQTQEDKFRELSRNSEALSAVLNISNENVYE